MFEVWIAKATKVDVQLSARCSPKVDGLLVTSVKDVACEKDRHKYVEGVWTESDHGVRDRCYCQWWELFIHKACDKANAARLRRQSKSDDRKIADWSVASFVSL